MCGLSSQGTHLRLLPEAAWEEAVPAPAVEGWATAREVGVPGRATAVAASASARALEAPVSASAQAPGLKRPACLDRRSRGTRLQKLQRRVRLRPPWKIAETAPSPNPH
jgi:hypothetical protein